MTPTSHTQPFVEEDFLNEWRETLREVPIARLLVLKNVYSILFYVFMKKNESSLVHVFFNIQSQQATKDFTVDIPDLEFIHMVH